MSLTNFPKGISSFGVPVLSGAGRVITGKVFFVDSATGSNNNNGLSPTKPFATLATAISACTASKYDVIFVMPGHAETNATTIAVNKIGISIIGLGERTARPTFTTTGAVVSFTVSVAKVTIENLVFAAPGIDTVTADIALAGAGCVVRNCYFIGSGNTNMNKVSIITLAAGADDTLIEGNLIVNDVVELTGGGIQLAGACSRVVIRDNVILDSIGLALGAVFDSATALNVVLLMNILSNAKANTVVLEFGHNTTGVCSFNHINGRHTTLASNVACGTGMAFFENRVVEQAALNGAIIPVADTE